MLSKPLYGNILLIVLTTIFLIGCATFEGMSKDVSIAMQKVFTGPEDSANGKEFKSVPFEMAINKAFDAELRGKDFKFIARYKGTVPNPGELKSVENFVNLKMCDLEKPDVCSDLIVIKSSKAKDVFMLSANQVVTVYGCLLEVYGVRSGDEAIGFNQMGSGVGAPYNFIQAYQVISAKQKVPSTTSRDNIKQEKQKPQNTQQEELSPL